MKYKWIFIVILGTLLWLFPMRFYRAIARFYVATPTSAVWLLVAAIVILYFIIFFKQIMTRKRR